MLSGGSAVRESDCNAQEMLGLVPGSREIPWRRSKPAYSGILTWETPWTKTVGYSPWGLGMIQLVTKPPHHICVSLFIY